MLLDEEYVVNYRMIEDIKADVLVSILMAKTEISGTKTHLHH